MNPSDRVVNVDEPSNLTLDVTANADRQVFPFVGQRPLERVLDPGAQRRQRDARRQPVNGHDAAGMERLVARDAELGVLEARQPASQLNLARESHGLAGSQPPLDIAPPEPDRLPFAGLVADPCDGALNSTPET